MIPQQVLIIAALIGLVFGISVYAFSNQDLFLLYVLVAFPPLVFLINRPNTLFFLAITLYASYLTLPFLPWNMNAFYLIALFLSAVMLANRIITKNSSSMTPLYRCALAFAAVLVTTASIRGFGVRFLGSETWGGSAYVQLLIAAFFLIMSRDIELTPRQWRLALYGLCLFPFLGPAAQALYAFSGGHIYQQFHFIVTDLGAVGLLRDVESGSQTSRFQVFNVTSTYLFTLALLVTGSAKPRRWILILLFGAAFVTAGLSGHRIALVYNLILTIVFFFLNVQRSLRARIAHPAIMAFLAMAFLAAAFGRHLPYSYQRALSWVPFSNISLEARDDARETAVWRLQVWRQLLKDIPTHLLIGKGFAFSGKDIISMRSSGMTSVDAIMLSRNYHNGVLSLLVDLGIPGLFSSAGFVAAMTMAGWSRLRRNWNNQVLKHYHRVALSCFIAQVIVYVVMAGGATTFVALFLWAAITEGLAHTDAALARTPAPKQPVRMATVQENGRPLMPPHRIMVN